MAAKKNDIFAYENVDVSKYVNKKMGLSYLNWAFVIKTLRTVDPDCSYKVTHYDEINLKTGQPTGRKVNYFMGINGADSYVTVTVTFKNHSLTESLPCYDFKGKAVQVPDAMLVNKSIKRCATKAFAELTGLGINLYINGNPEGGNQNSNSGTYRRSYRSNNRSSYRNQNRLNDTQPTRQTTKANTSDAPSEKQISFIQNLLKKVESDGSKQYQYLFSNRGDLADNLTGQSASNAISFLLQLKKKSKKSSQIKSKTNEDITHSVPNRLIQTNQKTSFKSEKKTKDTDDDLPF